MAEFNPNLVKNPPVMEGEDAQLNSDPQSDALTEELAVLMNETWDELGQLLDTADVTVVAVKYALPADKLNAILEKYLPGYNKKIDVIAHVYGQTTEEGETALGADIEYYYAGLEFAPILVQGPPIPDPETGKTSEGTVFDHTPTPVEVLNACLSQDTNVPTIFIDIPTNTTGGLDLEGDTTPGVSEE